MTALFDDIDTDASDLVGHQFETEFDDHGKLAASLALSKMYSRPELAVLREYVANALDATDEPTTLPIQVKLPTYGSPVFEVRDYGPGMSFDTLSNKFFSFKGSDKKGDTSKIGAFGFGSKSAYAVSDGWSLVNTHDGVRTTVSCTLAPNGVRKQEVTGHEKVDFDPNDPSTHSGVHIIIPMRSDTTPGQLDAWKSAAEVLIPWLPTDRIQVSRGGVQKIINPAEYRNVHGILFPDDVPWNGVQIKVNGVIYNLHDDTRTHLLDQVIARYTADDDADYLSLVLLAITHLKAQKFVLEADETRVDISPTRESVIAGSRTTSFFTESVITYVDALISEITAARSKPTAVDRIVAAWAVHDKFPIGNGNPNAWASALDLDKDMTLGPMRRVDRTAIRARVKGRVGMYSASSEKLRAAISLEEERERVVRVSDVIYGPANATLVTECARKTAPSHADLMSRRWGREVWWIDSRRSPQVGDLRKLLTPPFAHEGTVDTPPDVLTYTDYKKVIASLVGERGARPRPSVNVVYDTLDPETGKAVREIRKVELVELESHLNTYGSDVPKTIMHRAPSHLKGIEQVVIELDRRRRETVLKHIGSVTLTSLDDLNKRIQEALDSQVESLWESLDEASKRVLAIHAKHASVGYALTKFLKVYPDVEQRLDADGAALTLAREYREGAERLAQDDLTVHRQEISAMAKDYALDTGYELPELLTKIPSYAYMAEELEFANHVFRYLNTLSRTGH